MTTHEQDTITDSADEAGTPVAPDDDGLDARRRTGTRCRRRRGGPPSAQPESSAARSALRR